MAMTRPELRNMQCVQQQDGSRDQRWIALNKDTFQEILDATLDKMTATSIGDTAETGNKRSSSPSLPSDQRYPIADIPQLSAASEHTDHLQHGEPLDLSNKSGRSRSYFSSRDINNDKYSDHFAERNTFNFQRSNLYEQVVPEGARGFIRRRNLTSRAETPTFGRRDVINPTKPLRRNSAPNRISDSDKTTWMPCSKNTVHRLIEKVVSNMDDFDDTDTDSIREDENSSPTQLSEGNSPERSSTPCWVALSKMYVCDIVESVMSTNSAAEYRVPEVSDKLLKDALQGKMKALPSTPKKTASKNGVEKSTSVERSTVNSPTGKTGRKSPPKRRPTTPVDGASSKRRKNRRVSAVVWDPPKSIGSAENDDSGKFQCHLMMYDFSMLSVFSRSEKTLIIHKSYLLRIMAGFQMNLPVFYLLRRFNVLRSIRHFS